MEQVTGTVLRADKKEEIWEIEEWGPDEWVEQTAAEMAFAMAMNVQYAPERNNLDGIVAGYRVRRAQKGLVLVPSDSDEEIFVAVRVVQNKKKPRSWVGCADRKGRFRPSTRRIVGSFPQKRCIVSRTSRVI